MKRDLSRLAARIFNTPLLVLPDVAETIAANLADRLEGGVLAAFGDPEEPDYDESPYQVSNGVATIPVRGELVNRGSWLNSLSGLTSYDALKGALQAAASDPRVERVVLDIDSPGGEAAGAMETAAEVRALTRFKPVTAYVNSMAASAAYAIAAGAGDIVASPSATVGSIGVVWLHMDRSQSYMKRGVTPTLLHAGAFKVDGNSLSPLEPVARARIQSQIEDVYDLFLDSVAKHRPKLGRDGARQTEAGIFLGKKAVDAGLADRVGDITDIFKKRDSFSSLNIGADMANETTVSAEADAQKAAEAAKQEKEKAAMADALAVEAAFRDGARAERERIKSILGSEQAAGKQKLAMHFAMSTELSPEAVLAALSAAASEQTKPSRLDSVVNPNLQSAPPREGGGRASQAEVDAGWTDVITTLGKTGGMMPLR